MGTLTEYYTNINYPGYINKDLNGTKYTKYLNVQYYEKIFNPMEKHTPVSSIHSLDNIDTMLSDYDLSQSICSSRSHSICSNNSNISLPISIPSRKQNYDTHNYVPRSPVKTPVFNSMSLNGKILLLQKENTNLRTKIKSHSDNMTNFINQLAIDPNSDLSKRRYIQDYAIRSNIALGFEDLDTLTNDELNTLYNNIKEIVKKTSKLDFSTTIIRTIFTLIEKICVNILKLDVFKGISVLSDELINDNFYSSQKFIKDKIAISEFPFMDIVIHIFKKILSKYALSI